MKNNKDIIFIVILILIGATLVFIGLAYIYLINNPNADMSYFLETQKFLGISLITELAGGFSYNAVKKIINKNNNENIENLINENEKE